MTDIWKKTATGSGIKKPARFTDINLTLLITAVLAGLIVIENIVDTEGLFSFIFGFLRLLLGLVFIFYLPGYYLTAALFTSPRDLNHIDRVGLSLGLSVAWVPLMALILNALPWGLRPWPIFIGGAGTILLLASIVTVKRNRTLDVVESASGIPRRPADWWRNLSTTDHRVYGLSAAALVVAGVIAAWVFLVPKPAQFMTEFFILGQDGLAEAYPRDVIAGEDLSVTMGIVNRERTAKTYRVEVWVADQWDGRRELVAFFGPQTLNKNSGVEFPVNWQMPWSGEDLQINFYLFVEPEAGELPYRELKLVLNVGQ